MHPTPIPNLTTPTGAERGSLNHFTPAEQFCRTALTEPVRPVRLSHDGESAFFSEQGARDRVTLGIAK